jgi:hypothetical protein
MKKTFLSLLSCSLLFSCGKSGPSSSPSVEEVTSFKAYSYSDRPFPDDNHWNKDISNEPVDPNSDTYINSLGKTGTLHADFGTVWEGAPIGIPYSVVPGNQPKVPVSFDYTDSSDPGPYPIPANVQIQGGPNSTGDRHVIVVDKDNGLLYEMYSVYPDGNGGWHAGSGAVFDLKSNKQRPTNWTSADAAGLPIYPALVRYEDVVIQKEIRHAMRFTANKTRRAFVFPATHQAGSTTDASVPPMGIRLRLKAGFDISTYPEHVQIILRALKKYGMYLADNGTSWQITGAPNENWDDQELHTLRQVPGSAFEVIKLPELQFTPW